MEEALSQQPASFVVEFMGLPGSGKSTLAHAVATRLGQDGSVDEPSYDLNHRSKRWHRVATKIACIVRCVVADPLGSLQATVCIARSGQRSLNDLLNTTLNMLYICGLRRAVVDRPGIHILDQGFFQQVSSIRFSASRLIALAGLDRLARGCFEAPGRDAIILVDVEPRTALGRLGVREGDASRLERRLLRETHHVELAAAAQALAEARNALHAIFGEDSGLRVETLKNEDGEDVEAMATDLARRLLAWSSTPRPS